MADHLDVSAVASLVEYFLQHPGSSSAHIDVGQICCVVDDVFMITLIKLWRTKRLRHTPVLVNTVAKEIMRVESSKQIRSQTCCSVTVGSKNHLVAPAVSTDDYPVIQEDAHRRLSNEEQQALDPATEEERETARTIVSRLHVELGHSDPRGMIDSLQRKHAHRLIIAAAKKFSCSAYEEKQRRRLRPVAARVFHEPDTCLEVDQFEWKHPGLILHVLGTLMADAGGRAAFVTIHRVMDVEHGLVNVTGEIMLATLLNHWVKYYAKPDIVRNRSRRSFSRSRVSTWSGCQEHTSGHRSWEAYWKTRVLGKTLDTIKQSAIRVALRTPDSVSIQEIFDECSTAHNDLHRNRGFSPWQLLLGETPTDKTAFEDPDLAQCSVELVDEAAKQRLRVKEESYKAYIEEELSLRKRRKEFHQARSWRHWAAGEWCWYWRSFKHKGSRVKGGVFLGPARVLIPERDTTAEGVRMKGVVWITEGTSLVRCAVQHLRSLSESEKRLCSIASKTLSDVCHTAHFWISRHGQMFLMMLGKTKSQVGTHEAHEVQAVAVFPVRINLTQPHVWDLI